MARYDLNASMQSDQNHWMLKNVSNQNKGPDETEHIQGDLNLHMFEDTFSLHLAQIMLKETLNTITS